MPKKKDQPTAAAGTDAGSDDETASSGPYVVVSPYLAGYSPGDTIDGSELPEGRLRRFLASGAVTAAADSDSETNNAQEGQQ